MRPSRSRRPPHARTTQTGRLPDHLYEAIIRAADELLPADTRARHPGGAGPRRATLVDSFRVDPFQAGAGVSHNMNTNEVLANRAIEILHERGIGSGQRGDYAVVNPNDHVNMAQSTNDVFPTTMRVATLDLVRDFLPVARRAGRRVRPSRAASSTTCSSRAARTCRTPCPSGSARSSRPTR